MKYDRSETIKNDQSSFIVDNKGGSTWKTYNGRSETYNSGNGMRKVIVDLGAPPTFYKGNLSKIRRRHHHSTMKAQIQKFKITYTRYQPVLMNYKKLSTKAINVSHIRSTP